MTVRNAYVAETARTFAAEGLSIRVIPPVGRGEAASMRDQRTLYVPTGRLMSPEKF
jgi:hypothetical protein